MIKKIVHSLLLKRHFWRHANFNELGELYVSNMLRAAAATVFSIFVPIYLYKLGYSVTQIAIYFIIYFLVRMVGDVLSGLATGHFGPKHTLALSHTSNIINLVCLVLLPSHPELFFISAGFNALGTSLQFIPIYTDFSKVKDVKNNGKEQGFFYMLDSIGGAIGPLLGGFVAVEYGAKYTIIASIVLYICSLIPLMMSPEPVNTRQRLTFRRFPLRSVWRDIVSYSAKSVDTTITSTVWPLFAALVIFKENTYEFIGLITTISVITAIASAHVFGKIIDDKQPLRFFRITVVIDSLTYIPRLFAASFGAAVGINIFNQLAVTGMVMSYNKGLYDAADDLPGYRIVYFTILELLSEIPKLAIWVLFAVLTCLVSDVAAMRILFVIGVFVVPLIMSERFGALRPGKLARLLQ